MVEVVQLVEVVQVFAAAVYAGKQAGPSGVKLL
jgi:hypothetical protein